jgi:EAL domain-containing protein (putative c-di-GMP-specific phosphodiesterase class I)/AmiR/NasT family two-component response regulator
MASLLLVVPDRPRRRITANILNRQPDTVVVEVDDVAGAAEALVERPFDIVIVDVDTPSPGWRAMMAAAREHRPGCLRLLITHEASANDDPVEAFERGEIHRFIVRPFQVEEMEEAIASLLQLARHVRRIGREGRDTTEVERRLNEAFQRNQLRLVFQPIVRVATQEIYGVELLLRSDHPELDGPLAVLDAAERCDRVLELGAEVNRLAALWAERIPEPILLFVNLHPAQLGDPELLFRFAPLLPYARRVVLEITERSGLADVTGWEGALKLLTGAGFRIAVDDLGAGYNGLNMLVALEPAVIKADASLIRGIDENPRKQGLLSLLSKMSGLIGAELVAEGVESIAEYDAAVRCGVDFIQGFVIARAQDGWPARVAGM